MGLQELDRNLGTKQQQNFMPVYFFFKDKQKLHVSKKKQKLKLYGSWLFFFSFGQYPNYKKHSIPYFLPLKYTSLFNKILTKYILKQKQYIYASPRKSVMFLFGILLK